MPTNRTVHTVTTEGGTSTGGASSDGFTIALPGRGHIVGVYIDAYLEWISGFLELYAEVAFGNQFSSQLTNQNRVMATVRMIVIAGSPTAHKSIWIPLVWPFGEGTIVSLWVAVSTESIYNVGAQIHVEQIR